MMKFSMMTMDTQTDSKYSEEKLKLRAECLNILLKNYGNINISEATYSTQDIYECAEEWCQKQTTTAGLVAYFKAYYVKNEDQAGN